MGDIAIDQMKFTRDECSLFPSSAAPQDLAGSGIGELICSCYANSGGACCWCFYVSLCVGFSIVIAFITAAARDNDSGTKIAL